MFYHQYKLLCEKKKSSPSRIALENGVSKTSVNRWKNGSIPNAEILSKLANYFNVSTDYLLGNETPQSKQDEVNVKLLPIIEAAKQLDDDNVQEAENYLKYLLQKQRDASKK